MNAHLGAFICQLLANDNGHPIADISSAGFNLQTPFKVFGSFADLVNSAWTTNDPSNQNILAAQSPLEFFCRSLVNSLGLCLQGGQKSEIGFL